MIVLLGFGILLAAWLLVILFGHGYVNTVEWIAWRLRVHARRVRTMHRKQAAIMDDRWTKEMKELIDE